MVVREVWLTLPPPVFLGAAEQDGKISKECIERGTPHLDRRRNDSVEVLAAEVVLWQEPGCSFVLQRVQGPYGDKRGQLGRPLQKKGVYVREKRDTDTHTGSFIHL